MFKENQKVKQLTFLIDGMIIVRESCALMKLEKEDRKTQKGIDACLECDRRDCDLKETEWMD